MKTKVSFTLAVLISVILFSCESRSGKRVRQIAKEEVEQVQVQPQKIIVNPEEQTIIGIPMSVSHAIELNSWNLSLDANSENGYAYNIEIDSLTAMKIIQDKSIVAVKVKGKSITLLR